MSSPSARQKEAAERRSLAPKPDLSPAVYAKILELRAQGDAVKTIAMALGSTSPSIRKIYQIIAEARAIHDPQPPRRRRAKALLGATPPKPNRPAGEPLAGWWFGVETITVTRLGFGSMDCLRVPVSVSCVPRQKAIQRPLERSTEVLTVSRSLSEAMAQYALRNAQPQSRAASQ